MTFKKFGTTYICKLKKGEKVSENLINFAGEQKIQFAWISGLGGFQQVTLGYYDLVKKEYFWKDFQGDLEITSFVGNIARMNGKPALHVHLNISNENQETFGGHFKDAVVGGTLELKIETFPDQLERAKDEETGLNLLEF